MRRHDLDWLRVLVFACLIFYHAGMFFVPWGWHIKNNVIYDWLRYPMLFLNQWRLPILFVISGMGTYFALAKRSAAQFSFERIKRLLLPLAFGMAVVVPPQVYIERIAKNQFKGSYFDFWPSLAFNGVYPEGNLSWHHLWFLPYLLSYSLILLPFFVYMRNQETNHFINFMKNKVLKSRWSVFIMILPLYFIEAFVEPFFPETHAFIGDWFVLINFLVFFFYGFVLMNVRELFWEMVERHRVFYLTCGLLAFTIFLFTVITFEDSTARHFTEAMIKVFNIWSWILAIFGFAAAYLNKPGKVLNYCNEAVYPFYILHQTVMIIIAYFLMNLSWGLLAKGSILSLGTFLISWIIYEFGIRRWKVVRPFFGLK